MSLGRETPNPLSSPSPLQGPEGAADEGFDGGVGLAFEHLADGLARIDLFVAERDEGKLGIRGGRADLAGGGVLPVVEQDRALLEPARLDVGAGVFPSFQQSAEVRASGELG